MSNFMLLADKASEIAIGTENGFCTGTANVWQIIGYVLLVFKIVIPLLVIVYGALDLGKAVIASKDEEIKKSIKGLTMRAIAAVVIFLLPTIISFIFGMISDFSNNEDDYAICRACITSPGGTTCKGKADEAWGEQQKDE